MIKFFFYFPSTAYTTRARPYRDPWNPMPIDIRDVLSVFTPVAQSIDVVLFLDSILFLFLFWSTHYHLCKRNFNKTIAFQTKEIQPPAEVT